MYDRPLQISYATARLSSIHHTIGPTTYHTFPTPHIIIVFETFDNAEQADEVRAFAHDLMKRNRAHKREAERPANFSDVQAFVASIKEVIAEQVSEEERARKVCKIQRMMDAMDVRECHVDLRVRKRPR